MSERNKMPIIIIPTKSDSKERQDLDPILIEGERKDNEIQISAFPAISISFDEDDEELESNEPMWNSEIKTYGAPEDDDELSLYTKSPAFSPLKRTGSPDSLPNALEGVDLSPLVDEVTPGIKAEAGDQADVEDEFGQIVPLKNQVGPVQDIEMDWANTTDLIEPATREEVKLNLGQLDHVAELQHGGGFRVVSGMFKSFRAAATGKTAKGSGDVMFSKVKFHQGNKIDQARRDSVSRLSVPSLMASSRPSGPSGWSRKLETKPAEESHRTFEEPVPKGWGDISYPILFKIFSMSNYCDQYFMSLTNGHWGSAWEVYWKDVRVLKFSKALHPVYNRRGSLQLHRFCINRMLDRLQAVKKRPRAMELDLCYQGKLWWDEDAIRDFIGFIISSDMEKCNHYVQRVHMPVGSDFLYQREVWYELKKSFGHAPFDKKQE